MPAIVGGSGGGKTTLVRYLMELTEANNGDIQGGTRSFTDCNMRKTNEVRGNRGLF